MPNHVLEFIERLSWTGSMEDRSVQLKIRGKLSLGFGVLVILFALLGGFFFYTIHEVHDELMLVVEQDATSIANVAELFTIVVDMEKGQHNFITTGKEELLEPYHRGQTRFAELMRLERIANRDQPDALKLLDVIDSDIRNWQQQIAGPEIVMRRNMGARFADRPTPQQPQSKDKDKQRGSSNHTQQLDKPAAGTIVLDDVRYQFQELIAKKTSNLEARHEKANRTISHMTYTIITSVVIAILLSMIVEYIVSRQITVPVRRLATAVGKVARGDLSTRIDVHGTADEIHDLAMAFNTMVENLNLAEKYRLESEQIENDYAMALESTNLALEEASSAAENANMAKGEFLANMSHEIRTPMTAILGFTEVVLDNVKEPENIEALETIRRNGNHLLAVINDILDLSKIDSGKVETECIKYSLPGILKDVQAMVQVRIDAKGLEHSITFAGPVPRTINTDPTRLRQILLNIIGNAVKFTETGSIRQVVQLIDTETECPRIRIDITDTGIGLTEQQKSRLFQPFSQADSSITRKFGGTGLGLTISLRLAQQLGGDVTVESTSGEGSVFTITTATGPIDPNDLIESFDDTQQAPIVEKPKGTRKPLAGYRILLAEDGPDNQRLITFVLKKAGAEVVLAENGQIALDEALGARDQGAHFDVILMDIQMPILDGLNATRQLRAADYSGAIIALTAHAMSSFRDKTLEAGCDGYATKPLNRDQLIRTIVQLAEHEESQAPPPVEV